MLPCVNRAMKTWQVMTVGGTRPEVIKLAPVIRALRAPSPTGESPRFRCCVVLSGQHRDITRSLSDLFGITADHDLDVMRPAQTPNQVMSRVLEALDPLLELTRPDVVLVQGDTTTALSSALAAFHRGILVGHVEAGLRTASIASPFPEEMNRRVISRLATFHFAATSGNRATLVREGVDGASIAVTGNPVVDALRTVRSEGRVAKSLTDLLKSLASKRIVALTTHRRENFGTTMEGNLRVLAEFVRDHSDVAVVFPTHPNPAVQEATRRSMFGVDRIHLLPPLDYPDFIHLLSHAWLIVSDSGGVQEEAPSLGRPLLVIRAETERPEAIESGVARLVGNDPERLRVLLHEIHAEDERHPERSWVSRVKSIQNPFGDGTAGEKIARSLDEMLARRAS